MVGRLFFATRKSGGRLLTLTGVGVEKRPTEKFAKIKLRQDAL